MNVATLACANEAAAPIPHDLPDTHYVADLCHNPGDLTAQLAGADRVVTIIHLEHLALATLQHRVRAAGIDPLGAHLIPASSFGGDPAWAGVVLNGARARVAASAESLPEHARPTLGGARSRREVLQVPLPHYEPVPVIDAATCAAGLGCRACVSECPVSAYTWTRGRIRFDRDACVGCGRCLTACPTAAISNPTVAMAGLRAQIEAIAAVADRPVGTAFVCRRRTQPIAARSWAEIEVPCTGMVPANWPLAALLLGAAASAVVPCSETGCNLGHDDRARQSVALAAELLRETGLDAGAVTTEPGEPRASLGVHDLTDPFGVHGAVEVALALQSLSRSEQPITAAGPLVGRGVVAIDPDTCTLCLACTETCPTGALRNGVAGGEMAVTFDAASCTGCAQCVPVCPEIAHGTIAVDRRIDAAALTRGRHTLVASPTALCELCSKPIASQAMLARIGGLLGPDHAAALGYIERRCLDCRGAG